jgi:hypothetical protein
VLWYLLYLRRRIANRSTGVLRQDVIELEKSQDLPINPLKRLVQVACITSRSHSARTLVTIMAAVLLALRSAPVRARCAGHPPFVAGAVSTRSRGQAPACRPVYRMVTARLVRPCFSR